ncbi:MAG: response regulator transcription factor [Bacteroidetes bacterium]|jgi:two-component system, LytTR family, response regulator LytT|nr:response regulator transcription factor [Bacteroidota bacterium]MBT7091764.1 response regulator transcription factor [Bacteroidota bacterium]MBT7464991.1 response regulator transcription factor [Bacteroidota bacterium]
MKVLIVEDEVIAVRNLQRLIAGFDPDIQIEKALHSVEAAVDRLSSAKLPDLIFMDIQLSDGLCFEILNSIRLDVPVIFTTAFDEYAINAFDTLTVDYLLKPIGPDSFNKAMEKYLRSFSNQSGHLSESQLNSIIQTYHERISPLKRRFLVRSGKRYKSIPIEDIAYFYKDELTYLVCWNHDRFLMDEPLTEIESYLSAKDFFRISRQYIVHIQAIDELIAYSGSRLKVKLLGPDKEMIVVSQATASELKKWLSH